MFNLIKSLKLISNCEFENCYLEIENNYFTGNSYELDKSVTLYFSLVEGSCFIHNKGMHC